MEKTATARVEKSRNYGFFLRSKVRTGIDIGKRSRFTS